MIPGETLDGVYISTWEMTRLVYAERIRYTSDKYAERLRIRIARCIPRAIRVWIIVLATARAMGDDKAPDEVTYPDIYDAA